MSHNVLSIFLILTNYNIRITFNAYKVQRTKSAQRNRLRSSQQLAELPSNINGHSRISNGYSQSLTHCLPSSTVSCLYTLLLQNPTRSQSKHTFVDDVELTSVGVGGAQHLINKYPYEILEVKDKDKDAVIFAVWAVLGVFWAVLGACCFISDVLL